jgi:hypothetical protein
VAVFGMSSPATDPRQHDRTSEVIEVGNHCTASPAPAFIRMRDVLRRCIW